MAIKIPQRQKAMVVTQKGGPAHLAEIDVPRPGPDEVLVNVKFSGVCHTDLHAVKGDWPLPLKKYPLVGGHEGAGVVVARGELVKDVELGEHVGIKWINGTCLSCAFCQAADEPLCPSATMSGYTVDGAFAPYALAKAAHVARLDPSLPLDRVAPILCAGVTVYKGLKESGARPGDTVAVVGAGGGLGSLALQYARAMGLVPVAVDAGPGKEKLCRELGAAAFVDFAREGDAVGEAVKRATPDGLGPHAVLLVAVAEKPFQQAAGYVRARGTVVCVGLPAGAYLRAPVFETVVRMVAIKGSYVGNRRDTAEALEFFRRGEVRAEVKVVPLSELPDVYEKMERGEVAGRYVLDMSK